jgi:hypothetical protein
MSATQTPTPRWTSARLFRSAFALTLGLLVALALVVTLLSLVFGAGGRETLEAEDPDDVVVEDTVAEDPGEEDVTIVG